jgi:hypothetical protein
MTYSYTQALLVNICQFVHFLVKGRDNLASMRLGIVPYFTSTLGAKLFTHRPSTLEFVSPSNASNVSALPTTPNNKGPVMTPSPFVAPMMTAT